MKTLTKENQIELLEKVKADIDSILETSTGISKVEIIENRIDVSLKTLSSETNCIIRLYHSKELGWNFGVSMAHEYLREQIVFGKHTRKTNINSNMLHTIILEEAKDVDDIAYGFRGDLSTFLYVHFEHVGTELIL